MVGWPCAHHRLGVCAEDDVADAIGRQLELAARCVPRQHDVDAREPLQPIDRARNVSVRCHVHARKRPERAVVQHVGIGDRKNHARKPFTEPPIEQHLKKNDPRLPLRVGLRSHPVVSGDDERRACSIELREPLVHDRIKLIGFD